MSNTPSDTQTVNLGFTIENRAGVEVLVWKDGGCRPAASAEVAMWKALSAVQQPVVREPLTKAQRTRLFRNRDMAGIKAQLAEAEWHRIVQYIEVVHHIKQGGQHGAE